MRNPQNVTIVLLTITAAILAAILAGAWSDRPAMAAYSSVSKGDYILVPYQWSDALDFMIVIDVAAHRMNVYVPNKTTKALDLGPQVDLERVFSADN